MGEESVELVKATYEAFGRGDVPAVMGAMATDIAWHEAAGMPYGGIYHGADAVAQNVFGPISTDVIDFAVTPEEYIASGDAVAAVVRYTGTGRTTGKKLDIPAVHVWNVRAGKLQQLRQFIDTTKFREVVPEQATE